MHFFHHTHIISFSVRVLQWIEIQILTVIALEYKSTCMGTYVKKSKDETHAPLHVNHRMLHAYNFTQWKCMHTVIPTNYMHMWLMHVLVLRYTLTDTPGRHHSSIDISEVNSPFLVQKLTSVWTGFFFFSCSVSAFSFCEQMNKKYQKVTKFYFQLIFFSWSLLCCS